MRRRRVFRRKRRVIRRRRRAIPRNRTLMPRVFNFKQNAEATGISYVQGTSALAFHYLFQLSDCTNNLAAFVALYDNYRIMGVKITFFPQYTQTNFINTSTTTSMLEIYTAFDPDQGAAPGAVSELDAYSNLQKRWLNRPVSRFIKPFPAYTSSSIDGASGTTVAGLISRKTWFNTQQAGIIYHSLIGAVLAPNQSSVPSQKINVTLKYYLQFRNIH